jgi:hypothetical protein
VKRRGVASEARQGVASKPGQTPGVYRCSFPIDSLYRISSASTIIICIPVCCAQQGRLYPGIPLQAQAGPPSIRVPTTAAQTGVRRALWRRDLCSERDKSTGQYLVDVYLLRGRLALRAVCVLVTYSCSICNRTLKDGVRQGESCFDSKIARTVDRNSGLPIFSRPHRIGSRSSYSPLKNYTI